MSFRQECTFLRRFFILFCLFLNQSIFASTDLDRCTSFCNQLNQSSIRPGQPWVTTSANGGPTDDTICAQLGVPTTAGYDTTVYSSVPSQASCKVTVTQTVLKAIQAVTSADPCVTAGNWKEQCTKNMPNSQVKLACLDYQAYTAPGGSIEAETGLIAAESTALAICLPACVLGDAANPLAVTACNISGMAEAVADIYFSQKQENSPVNQAILGLASVTLGVNVLSGGAKALGGAAKGAQAAGTALHNRNSGGVSSLDEIEDGVGAADKKASNAAKGSSSDLKKVGVADSAVPEKAGSSSPETKGPPVGGKETRGSFSEKFKARGSACATVAMMTAMLGVRSHQLSQYNQNKVAACSNVKSLWSQGAAVSGGGSGQTGSNSAVQTTTLWGGGASGGTLTVPTTQAANPLATCSSLNQGGCINANGLYQTGSMATAGNMDQRALYYPPMVPLLPQKSENMPGFLETLSQSGVGPAFSRLFSETGGRSTQQAMQGVQNLMEVAQAEAASLQDHLKMTPPKGGIPSLAGGNSSTYAGGAGGGVKKPGENSLLSGFDPFGGRDPASTATASPPGEVSFRRPYDETPFHPSSNSDVLDQARIHIKAVFQNPGPFLALMGQVRDRSGKMILNAFIEFELGLEWTCMPHGGDWVCFQKGSKEPMKALLFLEAKGMSKKENGERHDTLEHYEHFLNQGGEEDLRWRNPKPIHSGTKRVTLQEKQVWIDSQWLHLEVPGFRTRYFVTTVSDISVAAIFLFQEENVFSKVIETFEKTARVFKNLDALERLSSFMVRYPSPPSLAIPSQLPVANTGTLTQEAEDQGDASSSAPQRSRSRANTLFWVLLGGGILVAGLAWGKKES